MALVALGAAALAMVPRRAEAQVVRGQLVVDSGVVVQDGVLVSALDATGAVRATVLTRAGGRFALRVPVGGRYRLLARRIGVAPTTSAWLVVPDSGELSHELRVRWAPIPLAPVRVRDVADCRGRPTSARTLALFEQARLALETEALTRSEGAYGVEVETWAFLAAPDGRALTDTARLRRRGATTDPFFTVARDSLARRGYATRDRAGLAFHAPDSQVFLDDDFLRAHCLEDARGAPGLVAVGVRTAPWVRGVGIRGTLWLDSATLALRRLDYRYVRLPGELRGRELTGAVRYERVDEGGWIVREYWMRLPAPDVERGRLEAWRVEHVDRVQGQRVVARFPLAASPVTSPDAPSDASPRR